MDSVGKVDPVPPVAPAPPPEPPKKEEPTPVDLSFLNKIDWSFLKNPEPNTAPRTAPDSSILGTNPLPLQSAASKPVPAGGAWSVASQGVQPASDMTRSLEAPKPDLSGLAEAFSTPEGRTGLLDKAYDRNPSEAQQWVDSLKDEHPEIYAELNARLTAKMQVGAAAEYGGVTGTEMKANAEGQELDPNLQREVERAAQQEQDRTLEHFAQEFETPEGRSRLLGGFYANNASAASEWVKTAAAEHPELAGELNGQFSFLEREGAAINATGQTRVDILRNLYQTNPVKAQEYLDQAKALNPGDAAVLDKAFQDQMAAGAALTYGDPKSQMAQLAIDDPVKARQMADAWSVVDPKMGADLVGTLNETLDPTRSLHTLDQFFDRYGEGNLTRDDLKKLAAGENDSDGVRNSARVLLASPEFLDKLDVGLLPNSARDGQISRQDVDAVLLRDYPPANEGRVLGPGDDLGKTTQALVDGLIHGRKGDNSLDLSMARIDQEAAALLRANPERRDEILERLNASLANRQGNITDARRADDGFLSSAVHALTGGIRSATGGLGDGVQAVFDRLGEANAAIANYSGGVAGDTLRGMGFQSLGDLAQAATALHAEAQKQINSGVGASLAGIPDGLGEILSDPVRAAQGLYKIGSMANHFNNPASLLGDSILRGKSPQEVLDGDVQTFKALFQGYRETADKYGPLAGAAQLATDVSMIFAPELKIPQVTKLMESLGTGSRIAATMLKYSEKYGGYGGQTGDAADS